MPQKTRPIGDLADKLIGELRSAGTGVTAEVLESVLHKALEAAAVSALAYESDARSGGQVEFAVWSDDFEPWLGNPLLIEIKANIGSQKEMERTLAQVTKELDTTSAEWGLLIYSSLGFKANGTATRYQRVFVLSLEELLASMRDDSLGRVLTKMRNRRYSGHTFSRQKSTTQQPRTCGPGCRIWLSISWQHPASSHASERTARRAGER